MVLAVVLAVLWYLRNWQHHNTPTSYQGLLCNTKPRQAHYQDSYSNFPTDKHLENFSWYVCVFGVFVRPSAGMFCLTS